ncbi:hypothetical protein M1L60_41290 [Actinoplanes sp. TRM 88003]|uniref:DUF4190 domain-containing protein n=1 Tax=Paractinoplanes aksuensis TaxID=2939490 RepID=A0ABT1E2F9_9ACTN|nr:hypothetical protein [Actinoplanes aksuensis]MCO8277033.1 hypothetical protein [Actinoplanes aksuensis]
MTAEPRTSPSWLSPVPPAAGHTTQNMQVRQQASGLGDRYRGPAPAQARPFGTPPSSAYPGRSAAPAPRSLPPSAQRPPGIGTIIVVTFIFGLVGLVPTMLRARKAALMGASTTPYWMSFGCTMAVGYALGLALVLYSVMSLGLKLP